MPKPYEGPSWWFDPSRAGTMRASGLRSLLEGAHLTGPELFVREVTQNSVDAHAGVGNEPVRLRFASYELTPSQHEALRTFLASDRDVVRRVESFAGTEQFATDGGLFGRSSPTDPPTRVLLVEDFATKGLGGSLGGEGPDDHFSRLVYFFGQSHGDGAAGGAFGFGKSVYSVASSVRTVVYYSRPADGGPNRLIAVSLFPSHAHEGRKYTGYALCGMATDDDLFPIVPLEGEEADTLASAIGMSRRGGDDTGTSLLVVDCAYRAEELREALEKWWWPRLVTTGPGGLVVEMTQDGGTLPAPRPAARPDLEPFVRAYQHYLDAREDTLDTRTKPIRSTGMRPVGKLVLRRIELPEGADEDESWHAHTIAMFRGPRLVVTYAPLGRQHMTPFVGVFVADDDMDAVLRRAENPAHDTWAPESSRLGDGERTWVRAVEKHCRRLAADFQAGFDAKPLEPTSRLRALEDLLGRMFQSGTSPGPVPKGPERPVSLSVHERRSQADGLDEARIEVVPRDSVDTLPARVQVAAHLLGDAHRSHLDHLVVELFDDEGRSLSTGRQAEHPFELPPDGVARFVARTRAPSDSIVKFSVTVSGRSPS